MKSPELLVFHYPMDHRLHRERFVVDALEVLVAEPAATTKTLEATYDGLELADSEVCVIHKLLVTRPH